MRSCDQCLRHNKASHRQAKMVERPTITVPFDSVAFDIVGPLEKAKGGVRYILTYICMASRWPEAVPLRTVTAEAVSSGMVDIMCRTGIPSKLLTDRGTVFVVSRVCERTCEVLGVDRIQSAPYRPQSNGVLKRLHGTLKSMLSKAREIGVDWAKFLPLALYAIRQIAHSATGYSPHELVFGRRVTGPLDLLYAGWTEDLYSDMEVSEWVVFRHGGLGVGGIQTWRSRSGWYSDMEVSEWVVFRHGGLGVGGIQTWRSRSGWSS